MPTSSRLKPDQSRAMCSSDSRKSSVRLKMLTPVSITDEHVSKVTLPALVTENLWYLSAPRAMH